MLGNDVAQPKSDLGRNHQQLSIERACQEYNNSVKMTLDQINQQLDDILLKNCDGLDELCVKIAARTTFLEKNPSFLSCLVYEKTSVKKEALLEFDDIRITLKEHARRIGQKLEEIEKYHNKLLDLVIENGENTSVKEDTNESVAASETETPTDGEKVVEEDKTEAEENHAIVEPQLSTHGGLEHDQTPTEDDHTSIEEQSKFFLGQTRTHIDEEEDFQDCLDKLQHKDALELVLPRNEIDTKDKMKTDTNVTQISSQKKFVTLKTVKSYNKVTIKKNAFSDMSLGTNTDSPIKFHIFSDILPDVQRRRPTENLHGKLIQQLVASDSLEGFLKLMERKPTKEKFKKKKDNDLEEKYTGSLWFFPKDEKKRLQHKSASVNTKISPIPHRNLKHSSAGSTCCNLLVTSSQPCPTTNQERTRKIRQSLNRNKLKYYDLLDDLDYNDLKPIKSEYPRRDNPIKLQEAKSYLHRMMQENEKVWKKLLQPIEDGERKKKKQVVAVKKSGVKSLLEYLTSPEQKYLSHIPQSLIVMPVRIIYDNFPTRDKSESNRRPVLITDLTKSPEPKRVEGRYLKSNLPIMPEPHRPTVFPVQKKKAMLEQLKGLKLRNDNIQKNIQKAIDVIETKMIDLLSSPTDATNSEAFNAMEKEITNVLVMMNENDSKEKGDTEEATKENKQQEEKDKTQQHEEEENKPEREENEKKIQLIEEKEEKKPFEDIIETKKPQKEEENNVEVLHLSEKQIVPEKDNSIDSTPTVSSPKLKRELTVVKKSTLVDLKLEGNFELLGKIDKLPDLKKLKEEHAIKIAKEEKKSSKEGHVKPRNLLKEEKRSKKREHSPDKFRTKSSRHEEDLKKAANIEEGERLLGQVDSVIKKIDSIYSRFYDENTKNKYTLTHEANFTNISDFFDGLIPSAGTTRTTGTLIEIMYKYDEVIPEIYYNSVLYNQPFTWYIARQDYIPIVQKEAKSWHEYRQIPVPVLAEDPTPRYECVPATPSVIIKELKPDYECVQVPDRVVEKQELKLCESIQGPISVLKEVEVEPRYEHVRPLSPVVATGDFIAELWENKHKEKTKVASRRVQKFPKKSKEEDRSHEYTLQTFYTLFFSSLFVALNFDYIA